MTNQYVNHLEAANKFVSKISKSPEVQDRCEFRAKELAGIRTENSRRNRNGATTDLQTRNRLNKLSWGLLGDLPSEKEMRASMKLRRGFVQEVVENAKLSKLRYTKNMLGSIERATRRPVLHKVRTL